MKEYLEQKNVSKQDKVKKMTQNRGIPQDEVNNDVLDYSKLNKQKSHLIRDSKQRNTLRQKSRKRLFKINTAETACSPLTYCFMSLVYFLSFNCCNLYPY